MSTTTELTAAQYAHGSAPSRGRGLPAAPSRTLLAPLSVTASRLADDGFWGLRARINADATLGHCLAWQERAGWLGNFDRAAAGTLPAGRAGREFSDSEAYKLLEAYCWEQATHPSDELEAVIVALIDRVGAAQEADGYLNTNFGRDGQQPRYSDLEWGHELYNYGHLLQAAVARLRTHGPDRLLEIATGVADHVVRTFGADGIQSVCGHAEIEVGLLEFGRVTGNSAYRDQAELFLQRRGHGVLSDIEWGRSYFQDDIPIREAEVFRGHAVRALYLAAAAVDLAVETGDADLLATLERQWERTVATRTYITGGMGSHHQDEAFGEDFVLPSDRAYCESCAGIASIMVSWRLLLATGNVRYADLIERTLFNILATAPSADGRSFFYSNTLHRRTPGETPEEREQSKRADSSQRAPWFDVSCCPNNIARTFASLGAYVATVSVEGAQLHQYAAGAIEVELPERGVVGLAVATRYPDDGVIAVTVTATPDEQWSLDLRVPAWAAHARVQVNDEAPTVVEPGYARVSRRFAVGDTVLLTLPLDVRVVGADARIDAIQNSVAFEVGPVVYCLESVDLPAGSHVDDFVLDTDARVDAVDGALHVTGWLERVPASPWPYAAAAATPERTPTQTRLVPYHSWAERGPGTMRVWVRR
jgi:uncharacterized protein